MSDHVLYRNQVKQGLYAAQCAVTHAKHALQDGHWVMAYEYAKEALDQITRLQRFIESGDES